MDSSLEFDFDTADVNEIEEDTTVAAVCESIETNMWLADAYARRGSDGLAIECLRAAWLEYVRFRDILGIYSGDDLGERLVQALVRKADDSASLLAFGSDLEADRLDRVPSAA